MHTLYHTSICHWRFKDELKDQRKLIINFISDLNGKNCPQSFLRFSRETGLVAQNKKTGIVRDHITQTQQIYFLFSITWNTFLLKLVKLIIEKSKSNLNTKNPTNTPSSCPSVDDFHWMKTRAKMTLSRARKIFTNNWANRSKANSSFCYNQY